MDFSSWPFACRQIGRIIVFDPLVFLKVFRHCLILSLARVLPVISVCYCGMPEVMFHARFAGFSWNTGQHLRRVAMVRIDASCLQSDGLRTCRNGPSQVLAEGLQPAPCGGVGLDNPPCRHKPGVARCRSCRETHPGPITTLWLAPPVVQIILQSRSPGSDAASGCPSTGKPDCPPHPHRLNRHAQRIRRLFVGVLVVRF